MSDKPLTPIEIGLTAAIVAIEGNEPLILIAQAGDGDKLAGLPFGPFDAVASLGASGRRRSGADCEPGEELSTAFARLLARQLESLLMVLTAEQLASKGHSELPQLIQPSMAVAGFLLALLEAGSASQSGTADDYPGQVRRAAEGLKGIAEVLETMVGRARVAPSPPARA
ncbi:MAG: hypothetical protein ACRDOD_16095 [Streptosporangiaceae bacterium]